LRTAVSQRHKTEAEFKAYVLSLQDKAKQYAQAKAELATEQAEVALLRRTEQILRSRDQNIAEFNVLLEKERGVVGATAVQDETETVSTQGGEVDKDKGKTLDEISKVVANIKTMILQKHNKLKPQIVEFKAQRTKTEDVEAEYQKRKKAHDNTALSLQSERLSLEQEVGKLHASLKEQETSFHLINSLDTTLVARLEMVRQEGKFAAGEEKLTGFAECKTYVDVLNKSIKEQDVLANKLRDEKKDVSENHEVIVERRRQYVNLKTIMAAKLRIAREEKMKREGVSVGGGAPAAVISAAAAAAAASSAAVAAAAMPGGADIIQISSALDDVAASAGADRLTLGGADL